MLTIQRKILLGFLIVTGFYAKNALSHSLHSEQGGNVSSVGIAAQASEATQTIHVTASDDMRFTFSKPLMVREGEVIRFMIKNIGKIAHEFSIGDEEEQKAHQEMMRKMPDMVHNDANTITLAPGKSGEITWKFTGAHEVVFACNIPGHYEAGMYKKVAITRP